MTHCQSVSSTHTLLITFLLNLIDCWPKQWCITVRDIILYQDLPEADYTETPEELSRAKEIEEGLSVVMSLMIVHTQINGPFDTWMCNPIENIELTDGASTSAAKKTESLGDLPSVSPQQPVKESVRQEGGKLSPPSTLNKPPGETMICIVLPHVAQIIVNLAWIPILIGKKSKLLCIKYLPIRILNVYAIAKHLWNFGRKKPQISLVRNRFRQVFNDWV